jgi:hypothetical protein
MPIKLPIEEQRKKLDYSVELPPVFKLERLKWDRPYQMQIRLYDEYAGDHTMFNEPFTLKQVLGHFDEFVMRVVNVTSAMKKSGFNTSECKMILDYYYGEEADDVDIAPSSDENYYYALRVPQLRAAEVALAALEQPGMWNMDVTAARQKLHASKLKLWQALPDFYKGHADPMPQPLSYEANKPYPHLCSEDDLLDYEYKKSQRHWHAIERQADLKTELPSITDKRISSLTATVPRRGNPVLKSDNGYEMKFDYSTYDAPSFYFLDLIEMILTHNNPSFISYDAEGPWYQVLCVAAARHDSIRLLAIEKYHGYENSVTLTGTFYRCRVVEELLKLGAIEEVDAPIESIKKIPIRVKRLREMM